MHINIYVCTSIYLYKYVHIYIYIHSHKYTGMHMNNHFSILYTASIVEKAQSNLGLILDSPQDSKDLANIYMNTNIYKYIYIYTHRNVYN
jgi:hypothetical protein